DFVREDFPQENQKLAKEQRPNDRTKISNVFYTLCLLHNSVDKFNTKVINAQYKLLT
ncbi:hypothetical protein SAMN04487990_1311, partial [Bizionia paragorgiae]